MMYDLTLRTAGLLAGAFLLLIAMPGVILPKATANFAKSFSRSSVLGFALLTIAFLWSFYLLWTMEMGEFSSFRRPLLIALPIGFVLVLRFVNEFLAVRALGILCLLAAEPLLEAAAQAFSLRHLWADTAYQGLRTWLPKTLGWTLTITKHW